ncbi:4-hydroxyphenylpyruvate dioxygenase [Actinokineospora sp.]|uniref:4-hydroxyphenylpyruvate dioxygenase n=1 Tax=Actinokineospora sp. TaxID=1872133 RepID=UPI004037AEAF
MKIGTVDHVEFYVGDAQQAAFYLCTAFGFRVFGQGGPETGLVGQRSVLLSQGGIRILLTSGLAPGHPATEFVSRHGDGVAAIAFGTDDVATAYAEAVERGAAGIAPPVVHEHEGERVVLATVSGFGDVHHRLVERHTRPENFLPGLIDVIGPDPDAGDDLLREIDHFAVCLPAGTLGPTTRFYQDVFEFEQVFAERIEVGDQAMDSAVVRSPSGKATFTLIEPDAALRPGQIDDFLRRNGGAGVQHIAFETDDIASAVATLGRWGVDFLTTPASYYDGLEQRLGRPDIALSILREHNVLADRDHAGQMFQIFTKPMHVRHTLFFELIERHGALTFGSGNVRALYEAVERDQDNARQAA